MASTVNKSDLCDESSFNSIPCSLSTINKSEQTYDPESEVSNENEEGLQILNGNIEINNTSENICNYELKVSNGVDEDGFIPVPKASDGGGGANNLRDVSSPVHEVKSGDYYQCCNNEQDDISLVDIHADDKHEKENTDEELVLMHNYSEEIVQLVPPDLPGLEEDKPNLNEMKVMYDNFLTENNCQNVNDFENTKDDECIEAENKSNESAETLWVSKNSKTFELSAHFSNLSKLKESYSGSSIFDDLPDELLVKIFSFLTTEELCLHAAPVCRKWRAVSQDHSLWRSLDFSSSPHLSSLNFLWVIRRAPMLLRLVMSGRSHITHPEVAILTECCPLLEDIDFGFCDSLSCEMIKTVSENCPNLKKLNVEGCEKMDYKCTRYLTMCKELTHLNFSHCIALGNKAVSIISKGLPNLLSINLDGIDSMTDSAVESMVSCHYQHLQDVELDGAEISDIGIQQLSYCQQLKHLEMSFCECLTDLSLEYLMNLTNLENLRLRKGCDLSADGLSTFFKSASLSRLQRLNLSECTHVNDQVVLDIVQACGVRLKEMALSWCWFITDTGLISIVDHCSNMENLDLLGIDKIRGDCLGRVPEEMPKLKYLDLRQCNKIVDVLIVDVVRRKPDLRVLNYYGEEFVHD